METDRAIYLALTELAHRYDDRLSPCRSDQLSRYELRCFSQHGEDGVIAELLHRVGSIDDYFVEFGIESGREGNCVFLADVLDWRGLFIEPDAAAFASLERKYSGNPRVRTVNSAVTAGNVEQLFSDHGVPSEPDVLSIDVDGADYWIWQAIDGRRYRPRVLVIEYNAALPAHERLVQPRDHAGGWGGTDYFGASLQALIELGERKGYRFVHTDMSGANAFFVRSDLGFECLPEPALAARRSEPNYFMTGYHHPADPAGHVYVDPTAT